MIETAVSVRSCLWKLGRRRSIWRNRNLLTFQGDYWTWISLLHSFHWRWYPKSMDWKSSSWSLATAKIDGKEVPSLLLERKRPSSVASRLSDGPHTLTLRVKREHKGRGSERSKISLKLLQDPQQEQATRLKNDRDSHPVWLPSLGLVTIPNSTEVRKKIRLTTVTPVALTQATISHFTGAVFSCKQKSLALGRHVLHWIGKKYQNLRFLHLKVRPKREPLLAIYKSLTDITHPD